VNPTRLTDFFAAQRDRGEPLVLASVVQTGGSTYSKAGEIMLISAAGEFCGMLSGGCLEGDLVERSKDVFLTQKSQLATFDLSPDDELWGLGVGCDGTMQVLLQALQAQNDYAPFAAIVDVWQGRASASVAISPQYDIVVSPAPTLLVLGAGADAEPLVNMALELGWRCSVVDHRPAYVASRKFGSAANTLCCAAESMSVELELADYDMALVMSHHLSSDRTYLLQLAASTIQYVGLLGPRGRRDRLLADLGGVAASLGGRLHAPAGMQLGGRGAGPIAIEIVAQMQQFIATRQC
jgi:xanthine dehydrogenase accessory factor